MAKTLHFVCHDTVDFEEIESAVGGFARVDEMGRRTVPRTYLDSFDRRFQRRNLIVQCDTSAEGYIVSLTRTDGKLLGSARNNPILPNRPRDIFQPRLRASVQEILGPRVMLPVLNCRVKASRFSCRDQNDKVVAELSIEQIRVDGESGNPLLLVKLEVKKGYTKESKFFIRAILEKLPVRLLENDSAELLEHAGGSVQAGYTAKPKTAISKSSHTAPALADVLSAYRNVMFANEEGAAADIDPEFLHDFRIAMRRSRSILNGFNQAFSRRHLVRFRQEFAWLSDQTSELRDLDVFVADLESLTNNEGPDEDPAIGNLREIVIKRRTRALQTVRRVLSSKRYQRFRDDWAETLSTLRRGSESDFGKRRILAAANPAIWRRYKTVAKRIRKVRSKRVMEELHELRKDCKKLRYLIEAFDSLYPPKRVKSAVSELKTVQDVLGRICDRHTQKSLVAAWLGAASFEELDPGVRGVLGRLHASQPGSGKGPESTRLGSVLSRFGSPENSKLYSGLFKP